MKKFGGLSDPVNQGETNLKNRPLGEKRNINPIAIVIWGSAINGDIIVFTQLNTLVLKQYRSMTCEKNNANIVEHKPVKSDNIIDFEIPAILNEILK